LLYSKGKTINIEEFYKKLTPFYHLLYPNWEQSISKQAVQLEEIFTNNIDGDVTTILDVSCGIGTQSLGLAMKGYSVSASDLSSHEVRRAIKKAEKRKLDINFSVANMKSAYEHHQKQFDIVLSLDNAVPHLLNDDDILKAFKEFFLCTKQGGSCLISVRDYANEDLTKTQVKTYGLRNDGEKKYLLFQTWEFHNNIYVYS